jgi:hypothetical protein
MWKPDGHTQVASQQECCLGSPESEGEAALTLHAQKFIKVQCNIITNRSIIYPLQWTLVNIVSGHRALPNQLVLPGTQQQQEHFEAYPALTVTPPRTKMQQQTPAVCVIKCMNTKSIAGGTGEGLCACMHTQHMAGELRCAKACINHITI